MRGDETMRTAFCWLIGTCLLGQAAATVSGQDTRQYVEQAVKTELAADQADHSHWLYFEVDQKLEHPVKQWVAETPKGNLKRILWIDGRALTLDEQRSRMEKFFSDPDVLATQHKSEAHDDQQATEMLQMLPRAFVWTIEGQKGSSTILHFKPDPSFHPSNMESRVFAAMEGDMAVDTEQHRIVSLQGRLIHDVKILGGLLGGLDAGGTFDVERRETGKGVWQITETHVHIHGHALIFKTISEQEDDVKAEFTPLPDDVTMQQAKNDLLKAGQENALINRQVPATTPAKTIGTGVGGRHRSSPRKSS